jgi:hypothetical protein
MTIKQFAFLFAVVALLNVTLGVMPVHAQTKPVELYVASNGNDAWSGKLVAPNKAKTDGPFATVERARDVVRTLKEKNALAGGARVLVRGGIHYLKSPLVFTPQNSGTSGAPITYTAYRDEKPVLSGGRRITGWRIVNDKVIGRYWVTDLPEVKSGAWNFTQLFVNGERRHRPRLPKNGYYHITHAVEPSAKTQGKGHDRFAFRAGDINPSWHNIGDVEFLMMQIWTMARMRAANIDTQNNTVTFTGQTRTAQWYGAFPKGHRYIVENVQEALREPGQWYLDRTYGSLNTFRAPVKRRRTPLSSRRDWRNCRAAGRCCKTRVGAAHYISWPDFRAFELGHADRRQQLLSGRSSAWWRH